MSISITIIISTLIRYSSFITIFVIIYAIDHKVVGNDGVGCAHNDEG